MFLENLIRGILLFAGVAILDSSAKYVSEELAVTWRETLTVELNDEYLKERRFYHLATLSPGDSDNPFFSSSPP